MTTLSLPEILSQVTEQLSTVTDLLTKLVETDVNDKKEIETLKTELVAKGTALTDHLAQDESNTEAVASLSQKLADLINLAAEVTKIEPAPAPVPTPDPNPAPVSDVTPQPEPVPPVVGTTPTPPPSFL